jgi:hypothetical protein
LRNSSGVKVIVVAALLALAITAFAQQKPAATPRESGSDLLWKKLGARVDEIAARLDGVTGVAIVDLTDGRSLLRNAVVKAACEALRGSRG